VGSTSGTGFLPLQVFYAQHRCKKTFFTFFYFIMFLRLLTFFYFPTFILFFKKRWQSSERQADLREALSK